MRLRNALATGGAILAAGLLGLTSTATASGPTGGAVGYIGVNGSTATGTVAVDGTFNGGTYSFGGGTYGCVGGLVAGDVDRGAPTGTDLVLSTLTLVCATPLGINSTFSLSSGCTTGQVTGTFRDTPNAQGTTPNVHDGTTDTGPTTDTKFSTVDGAVAVAFRCITYSQPGGCSAKVSGTVKAYFNEATKTVNGVAYQDLILSGTGLYYSGATALCFGLITGGIVLNDLDFNIKATNGGAIDFRVNP